MENIEGKVAFVTGGASGIGLGMAKSFLKEGMKVAIADICGDRLNKAESILNCPERVISIKLDVKDRTAIEHAADETEKAFDKVHIVCNTAGIGVQGRIHEISMEEWKNVLDTNIESVFHGVQVFVPRIKKHDEGGHIVNTSAMAGFSSLADSGAYSVSKAAVTTLSEILRDDLAKDGISVSVLIPWIVNTPIFHPDLSVDDIECIKKRKEWLTKRFGISVTHPDLVGEMVLNGILNDDLYIFTDPISRKMIEDRINLMYAVIEKQFPGYQNQSFLDKCWDNP